MTTEQECPFCDPEADRIIFKNDLAIVIEDKYPISPGHSLIIPCRHILSIFDVNEHELSAIWSLIIETRQHINRRQSIDGFNLSVNIGEAAGQTVQHAHIHIIPRIFGDVEDATGGVRWIMPKIANYLNH